MDIKDLMRHRAGEIEKHVMAITQEIVSSGDTIARDVSIRLEQNARVIASYARDIAAIAKASRSPA